MNTTTNANSSHRRRRAPGTGVAVLIGVLLVLLAGLVVGPLPVLDLAASLRGAL